jgi:hypothetical protein
VRGEKEKNSIKLESYGKTNRKWSRNKKLRESMIKFKSFSHHNGQIGH